jgi:hypothetical protein
MLAGFETALEDDGEDETKDIDELVVLKFK